MTILEKANYVSAYINIHWGEEMAEYLWRACARGISVEEKAQLFDRYLAVNK